MNYTKLRKEKLELDYKVNKINNILDCEENLSRYIETIENNKLDTPTTLNDKILKKLNDVQSNKKADIKIKNKEKGFVEEIKEEKNIEQKNENSEDKLVIRLKYKFVNIVKIAACTIFALMIWEITPTNTTYAKKTNTYNTNQEQVDKDNKNKVDIQRKVNDFFMSPIKIERRDK